MLGEQRQIVSFLIVIFLFVPETIMRTALIRSFPVKMTNQYI